MNRISFNFLPLIFMFLSGYLLLMPGCVQKAWQIVDPYDSIDWQQVERHKANLHTHTTMSGAEKEPAVVIDMYHDLGYSVLALTDHDTDGPVETTWSWQDFGRDPDSLGMVAIQGNEISKVHHIGSHFNDYGNPEVRSEDSVLTDIGQRGGLAIFHHPGRYKKGVDWYADKYRKYDNLIGQEVFNKKNRYPQDRANWDSVLTVLMPARPVWGIASDDMHKPDSDLGHSWLSLLLPQLNEKEVRNALAHGKSFFIHSPLGTKGPAVPEITSIAVNETGQVITLTTTGNDSILWIANGQVVQRGNEADLSLLSATSNYLRAEVFRSNNVVCTQPFGLKKQ